MDPIVTPNGEASLHQKIDTYINAEWSQTVPNRAWLNLVRSVRNAFFGVEKTDAHFNRKYNVEQWFEAIYSSRRGK